MRSQQQVKTKPNLLVEDTDTTPDGKSGSSHNDAGSFLSGYVDLEMQQYVNNNVVNIRQLPRHQDSLDQKMKEIEDEMKSNPEFFRKRSTQARWSANNNSKVQQSPIRDLVGYAVNSESRGSSALNQVSAKKYGSEMSDFSHLNVESNYSSNDPRF